MTDIKWQQWVVRCWLGEDINPSVAENISKYNLWVFIPTVLVSTYVVISNLMLIYGLLRVSKGDLSISKKLFIYLSVVDLLSTISTLLPLVFMTYNLPCMSIRMTYSAAATLEFLDLMVLDTICTLRYLSVKKPLLPISNEIVYKVVGVEFAVFFVCLVAMIIRTALTESGQYFSYTQIVSTVVLTSFVMYAVVINLLTKYGLRKISKNGHSKKCCTCTLSGERIGKMNNDTDKMKYSCKLKIMSTQVSTSSLSTLKRCSSKQAVPDLLENGGGQIKFSSPAQNIHLERAQKQKREAHKTLVIITIFYIICYLPATVNLFVMVIGKKSKDFYYSQLFALLNTIWNLNAGINSTIYIVRTRELRQYFNRCFHRRSKNTSERNSSVVGEMKFSKNTFSKERRKAS